MQYISQETVHDFCRACLQELKNHQKCNIRYLDMEIRQWLQDATLDNPLTNDLYSSNICHSCRDKLEEQLEFRKMCARSLKTVRDILDKLKCRKQHPDNTTPTDVIQNLDWLEFDYISSVKRDDTIEIRNEYKFDIGIEENSISNSHLLVTKEEPADLEFNVDIEEEIKHHEENYEISENDGNESSSEYKFNKNDEIEFDSLNEAVDTNSPKDNKDIATKVKTPKTKKSDSSKSKYKFKCNQCDRKCLNQQTLDNHLRTHKGLKPFQCPKCDRGFNKAVHVREHLNEIHAEEKLNIICEYEGCGRQFQRSRSYKEHYRLKHIQKKKPVVNTEPRHVCEDCGKTFFKLVRLKQHQYTHKSKELYPFQCNDCDKAFTNQRAFSEHQLRHAGIKNFECPYCGMKKTTKNELRAHLNYHTKEKQWQCPRCPMIFNSTGNLRMHDQVVHQGLRRWTCRFCEESFGKQDSLKHHEMRHTGEKPHICTECDKRFIQKVALKAHLKTHNKHLSKQTSDSNIT